LQTGTGEGGGAGGVAPLEEPGDCCVGDGGAAGAEGRVAPDLPLALALALPHRRASGSGGAIACSPEGPPGRHLWLGNIPLRPNKAALELVFGCARACVPSLGL
jgi:hypothetical protein